MHIYTYITYRYASAGVLRVTPRADAARVYIHTFTYIGPYIYMHNLYLYTFIIS